MDRIEVSVYAPNDRRFLQLAWVDAEGRRRFQSAKTTDEREARQKAADLEYELNHGQYARPARQSWAAFRAAFEAERLPTMRPESRRAWRGALDRFEAIAHPTGLASVDARMVSRYHAALLAHPYAPNTIKAYLRRLRTALLWGKAQGLLATVPVFPRVKVPQTVPRPLAGELYERLQARAGDLSPLLSLGWLAGLRIGEAVNLRWEEQDSAPWVDLAANRLRFPLGSSKAKREDWLPMAPELRALLDAMERTGPWVVPLVGRGGRPGEDSARVRMAARKVKALAEAAGVRFTFHMLRKSFGTRWAARVPAQVLMRLMRHRSIGLALQFYVDSDAALEGLFGSSSSKQEQGEPKSSRS